jgi:hypothetical protein
MSQESEGMKSAWNLPEMLIFCHPGNTYRYDDKKNAAERCTEFTFDKYEEYVEFEPVYSEKLIKYKTKSAYQSEVPDFERKVGSKGKTPLELMVFVEQPVKRMCYKPQDFKVTRYIFHSKLGDLILPDLHVVALQADFDPIIDFRELYEKEGWHTTIVENNFTEKQKMPIFTERFKVPMQVIKPEELLAKAEKVFDYSFKNLYYVPK